MKQNDGLGGECMPAFLHALLENTKDYVFIKNTDCVYLGASRSFAALVGLSDPKEAVGKTDFALLTDHALAARYRADDERLFAGGQALTEYIEPLPAAEGEMRYCCTSKYIIRNETGAPVAMYGVAREITREYRKTLRSDRELRLLFELPEIVLCAALFDVEEWRLVDFRQRTENGIEHVCSTADAYLALSMHAVVNDERVRSFFHSFTRESVQAYFDGGRQRFDFTYLCVLSDGRVARVREHIYLFLDPVSGHLSAFFSLRAREEEVRIPTEAAVDLSEQKDLLRLLDENASVGVLCVTLDREGRRVPLYYVNDYLLSFMGYARETFVAHYSDNLLTLLSPGDAMGIFAQITEIADSRRDGTVYFHIRGKDDRVFWFSDHIRYLKLTDGTEVLFGIVTDITDLKNQQQSAEYRAQALARQRDAISRTAEMDVLTGLLNREATMREIGAFLEGDGADENHALFMIDIDNFKTVNDTLGHQIGDEALRGLAACIRDCFRASDIVGRIGGDEFFAFMKQAVSEENVRRKAKELIEALQKLYVSGGQALELSGSIGVSFYRGDGKRLSELYFEADSALYQAKSMGKNCFSLADAHTGYATDALYTPPSSVGAFSMRSLLNNLGGGIGIFRGDADGGVTPLFCNESLLHLMGDLTLQQYEDIYGENAFAGIHPDDAPRVTKAYLAARAAGSAFRETYRIRCAEDAYRYVSAVGNVVPRSDGSCDIYIVFTDAAQQVEEQQEKDRQFRAFQNYRRLAEKNTVASFQMNISTNWCGAGESASPVALTLERAGTVDAFFDDCRERFLLEEERAGYAAVFSREKLLSDFAGGASTVQWEHRLCPEPGRPVWVRTVVEMMENPQTHDVEALVYALNIHQEKTMQMMVDELLRADYRFLGMVDARTGEITVCGDGTNRSFAQLAAGSRYDDVMPGVLKSFIQDEYYEESVRAISRVQILLSLEKQKTYIRNFPVKRFGTLRDGVFQWRCSYLDGSRSIILISITDITEAVSSERDALSGLNNRQGFYRHVRERLDATTDAPGKLLQLDIDNFKMFNDAFGMEKGDDILRGIGATLRKGCTEPGAVCARLDADHYVVYLPADAQQTEEDILDHVNYYFQSYSDSYRLTAHLGVYSIEDPSADVSIMCDRALLALRAVKGSYSQRIAYYDDSLRDRLLEEQSLSDEMADGLKNGEFEIYLQPQVNYEDGSLVGAEALVRWNHPARGLIKPAAFIPLFERNGLITALDAYVWEQCCMHLRKWMDDAARFVPISVSVNISRIDIHDPALCDRLKGLVARYDLPPSMLKLEITESAYMQSPEQLIRAVRELRKAGFIIEMDDFGAGYSSLNTLKDVPVDILKLDIKFLSSGENDVRGGSILSSVIRMAHWLKIPVIAEGVENRAQADYLKSLNCCYMQGYYFDRPMPLDEFEKLLLKSEVGRTDRYADIDVNGMAAFWDPSAQTTLLFNSFVGGAAVMEYHSTGGAEILRANDMFYKQLGTTREAYLDKQRYTLERFAGKHREAFATMLESAAATGTEAECEVQSLPHEVGGGAYWLHVRARLLATCNDFRLFYLAVENVTARKHMEEELRLGKEAMQLAISNMGRIVCYYDVPTHVITFPEAYARQHGIRSLRYVVTRHGTDILPEDRPKCRAFYQAIDAGERNCSVLYRARNVDGSVSWEQADAATVFSDDGAPVSAVITISDVSAHIEQEAESARTGMLVQHAGVCVIDYDMATDTLHCRANVKGKGQTTLDIGEYTAFLSSGKTRVAPVSRDELLKRILRTDEKEPGKGSFELCADCWGTGPRWGRLDYVTLGDASGRVYRLIGQITDIQKEKDDAALIARLNETLSLRETDYAYSNAVVERVFSLLYGPDATEETVGRVLAVLGEHYDLSRVYIFEDDENHAFCSSTFEWCAPGVSAEMGNLQAVSYEADLAGRYRDNFDEQGVFLCRDIEALPEEQYGIFSAQGVRSLLQCAFWNEGVFCGFLGFDECRARRSWSEEQIGTLLLVSRIVGAFLTRLRKSEQAAFSADFRAALDNNAQYMYIIEPESHKVVYCNRRIAAHSPENCEGKICYEVFLHRSSPCETCPVRALGADGSSHAVEVQRPDGMLLLAQAAPLHWNGRDLMMLTCTDITERMRLRRALEEHDGALQTIYDTIPCGVLQYRLKGRKRTEARCNSACWRLFGYESEERYLADVLARRDIHTIFSEDLPEVKKRMRRLLKGGERETFEHRIVLAGGKLRRIQAAFQRTPGEEGFSMLCAVFCEIAETETH